MDSKRLHDAVISHLVSNDFSKDQIRELNPIIEHTIFATVLEFKKEMVDKSLIDHLKTKYKTKLVSTRKSKNRSTSNLYSDILTKKVRIETREKDYKTIIKELEDLINS